MFKLCYNFFHPFKVILTKNCATILLKSICLIVDWNMLWFCYMTLVRLFQFGLEKYSIILSKIFKLLLKKVSSLLSFLSFWRLQTEDFLTLSFYMKAFQFSCFLSSLLEVFRDFCKNSLSIFSKASKVIGVFIDFSSFIKTVSKLCHERFKLLNICFQRL